MQNEQPGAYSRRQFLLQGGKSLALLAVANTAVYAVGSAFKEFDGSLVAGAKCSPPGLDGNSCMAGCQPGQLFCNGTIYQCAPCAPCGASACN